MSKVLRMYFSCNSQIVEFKEYEFPNIEKIVDSGSNTIFVYQKVNNLKKVSAIRKTGFYDYVGYTVINKK